MGAGGVRVLIRTQSRDVSKSIGYIQETSAVRLKTL